MGWENELGKEVEGVERVSVGLDVRGLDRESVGYGLMLCWW